MESCARPFEPVEVDFWRLRCCRGGAAGDLVVLVDTELFSHSSMVGGDCWPSIMRPRLCMWRLKSDDGVGKSGKAGLLV